MFHKSISRRRADVPIRVRERIVHVKGCADKKRVVARRTPDQDERHRSDKPLRFSSLTIYFCICSRLSGGDPPVPPVATLLPGYFYKQALQFEIENGLTTLKAAPTRNEWPQDAPRIRKFVPLANQHPSGTYLFCAPAAVFGIIPCSS